MADRTTAPLDLLRFTPFRLNRLAAEFSSALAADYMARFGIDIPEWRVLATLGAGTEPRSAQYVVHCTRTHKSTISRAVNRLVRLGHVQRLAAGEDKRQVMLALTPQGRAIYRELVPLLLDRERAVLACLTAVERAQLNSLVGKLEQAFGLIQHAD